MTSKIETTKREMYRALAALKSGGRWLLKKQNAEAFEAALEEHLEETRQLILAQRLAIADLFMTKCTLVRQVEHLAHEADVLKDAARIAGEELRATKSPKKSCMHSPSFRCVFCLEVPGVTKQ